MREDEIWTVELNLDAVDYRDPCAWHIDTLTGTVTTNFDVAVHQKKAQRWVVIGAAKSHKAAHELSDELMPQIVKQMKREDKQQ